MPDDLLPPPPYWAVIFTSTLRADMDQSTYAETARRMVELARKQPGFLGMDAAREETGITVSYWRSLEDIDAWRRHGEHALARQAGRESFYRNYELRVSRVERAVSWTH